MIGPTNRGAGPGEAAAAWTAGSAYGRGKSTQRVENDDVIVSWMSSQRSPPLEFPGYDKMAAKHSFCLN